jgi:Flp pilus assembly protein TadG
LTVPVVANLDSIYHWSIKFRKNAGVQPPECAPMITAFPNFCRSTLRRLCRDQRGATAIAMAVASTVLLGFAGAGVDFAVWETNKRDMQGAADQAAYSAAVIAGAGSGGASCATGVSVGQACINAKGITAQMSFVDGQDGVTVAVNNPPTQGTYTTNALAWEVIVSKPQQMWFANMFLSSPPQATARAVAMQVGATVCMLILDPSASGALNLQGNPNINTPNCSIQVNSNNATALTGAGSSTITADGVRVVGNYSLGGSSHINASVTTGANSLSDPYVSRAIPSYTALPCMSAPSIGPQATVALVPGRYCNANINVGGATLNLTPGIYYLDRSSLSANNGTVNCPLCVAGVAGVTLVLTSSTGSNYSSVHFSGNSTISLIAPPIGPTAGMVFFQDRNAPSTLTNDLTGGSGQKFTGALYFPSVSLNYGGNASTQYCAQLIAKTVNFQGDASFQSNCGGVGTATISNNLLKLAE